MTSKHIDPTKLGAFAGAAAGHEGVLSDASGDLVIKPCTPAEVAFYELVNREHEDLAFYMPQFMGTLQLGNQTPASISPSIATDGISAPAIFVENETPIDIPATHAPSSSVPGTAATLNPSDPGPLKGKKLDTDLHIVLENVSAGFKQPNILDLKLGARLWDDDAKPEKRARLDKVAQETTSGSLGFRIAGMRVWQGEKSSDPLVEQLDDVVAAANAVSAASGENSQYWQIEEETNHKSYNKFYGRTFSADTVMQGFREFFLVDSAGITDDHARIVLWNFLEEVKDIEKILMSKESRMYSASLLFVYEGHPEAFKKSHEAIMNAPDPRAADKPDEDEDEEEEDEKEVEEWPKIHAIKLIDFAHARFEKGLGPDENMLHGVRSTIRVLEMLLKEISA